MKRQSAWLEVSSWLPRMGSQRCIWGDVMDSAVLQHHHDAMLKPIVAGVAGIVSGGAVFATWFTRTSPEFYVACIAAGVVGGSITMLLNARNPTRRYLIGEIMCSCVLGFAVCALLPENTKPRLVLLGAIAAGSTTSAGFRAWVSRFKPEWVKHDPNDGSNGSQQPGSV